MLFQNVNILFALFILPIIILLYIRSERIKASVIKNFQNYKIIKSDISYKKERYIKRFVFAFILITVASLIIALASPKWGIIENKISIETYPITILLDLSKSMDAVDIKPSRLSRAKLETEKFLRANKNIATSIVGFAGSSFIALPQTGDIDTISIVLNKLSSKSVTLQGTRFANALESAKSTVVDTTGKNFFIIITDGEDHYGELNTVVKTLKEMNVIVYAVSIGTKEGNLIPEENGGYKLDKNNNPILSKRNEDSLLYIVNETGGKLYVSEDGNIPFDLIFENIKKENNKASTTKDIRQYRERFQIFIFISVVLLFAILSLGIIADKRKA